MRSCLEYVKQIHQIHSSVSKFHELRPNRAVELSRSICLCHTIPGRKQAEATCRPRKDLANIIVESENIFKYLILFKSISISIYDLYRFLHSNYR